MPNDTLVDDITWIVLTNEQGEFSLWPACRPVPEGWLETGPEGDADSCAAWVDANWPALQPAGGAR